MRNFNFMQPVKIHFLALLLMSVTTLSYAKVDIQSWSSNGTKVLFVEAPQLPMLDIEISFDAGSARDGEVFGLANMTSTLMGVETSKLSEDQVSDAFNKIGAQIGSSVSRDKASMSLRTLTRPQIMQTALENFAELLKDSKFSEEIFKREMQRLKIALKQKESKPQSLSNDIVWQSLYGDHPYGHPKKGTLESIRQIDIAKIKKFYDRYYVANNAVIAIVGNIDKIQAKQIAEQLTAALPHGSKAEPLKMPVMADKGAVIEKQFAATQTYYTLTQLGIERGHKDYPALFVGNHLLGGSGFGSMLMEEVREKRGLVYSVYSYFAPLKVTGPFIVGLSTKNASAREADQVVKETLNGFLKDFSEEKLQAIKDNLIGGFPMRIDSNGKILGYLSLIGFYELPLDYLEWFPQQIEKVTKADILQAWNSLITPEKMTTIMVGKPQ